MNIENENINQQFGKTGHFQYCTEMMIKRKKERGQRMNMEKKVEKKHYLDFVLNNMKGNKMK